MPPIQSPEPSAELERLFTLQEFAEFTRTSERFARRLVAERRIRFVKLGKFVRIPESAVAEFCQAGAVPPAR